MILRPRGALAVGVTALCAVAPQHSSAISTMPTAVIRVSAETPGHPVQTLWVVLRPSGTAVGRYDLSGMACPIDQTGEPACTMYKRAAVAVTFTTSSDGDVRVAIPSTPMGPLSLAGKLRPRAGWVHDCEQGDYRVSLAGLEFYDVHAHGQLGRLQVATTACSYQTYSGTVVDNA